MGAESMLLHEQPCFALYSTVNAITRAYRPLLEPLGLTYTQYVVMLSLWERDGVSLRELSAHTGLDSPSLTPVIKRLAARGLVSRQRSAADERRLVLTLTEPGRRLRRDARDIPARMLCQVGLSTAEERRLFDLTRKILQSLGAAADEADAVDLQASTTD